MPARSGDIVTMVADTSRIPSTLDWDAQYDDLATMLTAHALAWEEKLFRERGGLVQRGQNRPEINVVIWLEKERSL